MKLLRNIDLWTIAPVAGLLILGLLALYSSSQIAITGAGGTNYFSRQLVWIFIGTIFIIILFFLPQKIIFESSYILYGLSIFTLILVLFFGKMGLGAQRWLKIGSLSFQPSELAKLSTIFALSRYLSQEKIDLNNIRSFLVASLFVFVPFLLVVRQPDLGTAIVFAAITLPMYYWAGLSNGNLMLVLTPLVVVFASFHFYAFLLIMIFLVLFLVYTKRSRLVIIFNFITNILVGLITPFLWSQLKPYQQNRIKIFLNPEADPKGAGYQIIQSKVAIGSGGISGKGFLDGSQTQLRFLPEQHTDFIYAVVGEEFGFLGVSLGLILFLILFIRGIHNAAGMKNSYNSIANVGIISLLVFHVIINIGMTIGLLPVTGLPLPFLSYGGTALLTNLIMIGILLNFYKNRYQY